jgi:hypothetical protein
MARVERGFRLLDSIAQIAPLLGLFGTVLGMIAAFQALQASGQSVDPAALAGGIWVALLTTAGGLAIAMPTSLALTWLESRTEADRLMASVALEAFCAKDGHGADRKTIDRAGTGPCALRHDRPGGAGSRLTSLIDVIFILLLFFMLSSTFTRYGELSLSTAQAAGGRQRMWRRSSCALVRRI